MTDPLSTLASIQVTTGTPEPLPPEPTVVKPTTFARALIQLAQLQTRLALMEQRSAWQETQLAELTARLNDQDGGK